MRPLPLICAGGLLAALVIAFFAYRNVRVDADKSAKGNEDGSPKN